MKMKHMGIAADGQQVYFRDDETLPWNEKQVLNQWIRHERGRIKIDLFVKLRTENDMVMHEGRIYERETSYLRRNQ